jgi:hypothetical protein
MLMLTWHELIYTRHTKLLYIRAKNKTRKMFSSYYIFLFPLPRRCLLGAAQRNPSPPRRHTSCSHRPSARWGKTAGRNPHGGWWRWGFRLAHAASLTTRDLGGGGSVSSFAAGAPWRLSSTPCLRLSLAPTRSSCSVRRGGVAAPSCLLQLGAPNLVGALV